MVEVLVGGASGGREVALAQAIEMSPEVSRVEVSADIKEGLDLFSGKEKPFVVIGPETLLVTGVADELRDDGYTVLGVGKDAAQYEASKLRTLRMAQKSGVKVPKLLAVAEGDDLEKSALTFAEQNNPMYYVAKLNELAGGKGVLVENTQEEMELGLKKLIDGSLNDGKPAKKILFQERINQSHPEVSVTALVGGEDDFLILPLSQDHKRLKDNDEGPNTGGMGAYSPVPKHIVGDDLYNYYEDKIESLILGAKNE